MGVKNIRTILADIHPILSDFLRNHGMGLVIGRFS
jgi:hypothetical protein